MNITIKSQSTTQQELRATVQLDTQPERIQHMSPSELVIVQSRLGYGDQYGMWITPREWLPAGSRGKSHLRINLRDRLTSYGVSAHCLEDAVMYYNRYAVLLALAPSGIGKRTRNNILKPSTICCVLYKTIPVIMAEGITLSKENGQYVQALNDEDVRKYTGHKAENIRHELNRIHKFCDLGMWSDRPGVGVMAKQKDFVPLVSGPDIRPKKEVRTDPYKPISDDWVADAGWRVLWLVRDLGPNLLTLGRQLAQIVRSHPHIGSSSAKVTILRKRRDCALILIAAHCWIDRHGHDILTPPFPLTVSPGGGKVPPLTPGQWPPTHVSHIFHLLHLLQYAHLFISLLAVGSRISDMLSLEPSAIKHSSDGTPFVNGLTFKITQLLEGKERDWPLPDAVLDAISQQEAIQEVFAEIGFWSGASNDDKPKLTNSLWASYGTGNEMSATLVSFNLRRLVKSIGLTDDPDDQNLSTHRFRKTLARLVALAVVGAPKILMDLFGHKTIEMTLNYILTDPDIAAEAKQISEEMIIMRATIAIENIDDYGGRAVKTIKRMVEQERFRLGKDLGAEDIRELAEILTMNGQAWELSRPGVICTKLPGSYGECSKAVGHPEPSNCGSGCDYRLEEAFLRKDVDSAIAESIRHYEAERDASNGLMQDFWAGQVLTHLKRFEDLRRKWSAHSSVQELLRLEG